MRGIRLAVVVVGVVACSGKKGSGGAGSGSTLPIATPTGGDAPLVIALYPDRWKAVEPAAKAVIASVPLPQPLDPDVAFGDVKEHVASAWALLRVLADEGSLDVDLPAVVAGLDDSRPIVIEAFEPIDTFEASALAAATALAHPGTRPTSGVRIRVHLPAKAPAAVVAALVAAMRAADQSLKEIAAAPPTFGDERRLVRFVEDKSSVTIAAAWGYSFAGLDAPTRDRVLGPAVPWVPALHPLMADPSPSIARAHLRFDRFAMAGSVLGVTMTARAMVEFADDRVADGFLAGFSEAAVALLINDPHAMTVSDAIIDLSATEPYGPTLTLALTDRGKAAMTADVGLASGKPIALAAIDLPAIAAKAPRSKALGDAKTLADVTTMLHECGPTCLSFLGLGNGIALVTIAETAEPGATRNAIAELQKTNPAVQAMRLTLAGSSLVIDRGAAVPGVVERARALAVRPLPPTTPAHDCYTRALSTIRHGMKSAYEAGPVRVPEVLDTLESEIRNDLACADQGEMSKRVDSLRKTLTAIRTLGRAEKPPQ
jgi:hypothetical protein